MLDRELLKVRFELEIDERGVLLEILFKFFVLFFMIRGLMFRESVFNVLVIIGLIEIIR